MAADEPPAPGETRDAPSAEADGAPRAEMLDAAPLLTWRKLYVLVLGTLATEIAIFAVVTWLYR